MPMFLIAVLIRIIVGEVQRYRNTTEKNKARTTMRQLRACTRSVCGERTPGNLLRIRWFGTSDEAGPAVLHRL